MSRLVSRGFMRVKQRRTRYTTGGMGLLALLLAAPTLYGSPQTSRSSAESLEADTATGLLAEQGRWKAASSTSATADYSLHGAWNAQLAEPAPTTLFMLDAGASQTSSMLGMWSWVFLAAGLVLGGGVVWLFTRRREKPSPFDVPRLRPVAATGGTHEDISLVSSQRLADDGSILVVDVLGEQLVLGISGRRDYVTLLTKLGEHESHVPHYPGTRLEDVMTAAGRGAPASAPGPVPRSAPSNVPSTGAGALPPLPYENAPADEDLEELLDELLGKVRGLKPLAKRADES